MRIILKGGSCPHFANVTPATMTGTLDVIRRTPSPPIAAPCTSSGPGIGGQRDPSDPAQSRRRLQGGVTEEAKHLPQSRVIRLDRRLTVWIGQYRKTLQIVPGGQRRTDDRLLRCRLSDRRQHQVVLPAYCPDHPLWSHQLLSDQPNLAERWCQPADTVRALPSRFAMSLDQVQSAPPVTRPYR